MITIREGTKTFQLRAVGVAFNSGQVLLHRSESEDFWSLPGGRVEFLESAQETLRREMQEELGVEGQVGRLLWVSENFFISDGTTYHELGLYMLIDLPLTARPDPIIGVEEGQRLVFQWFPVGELDRVPLYPTFLRRGLQDLPAVPQHVVHHDDSYLVVKA